MFQNHFEESFMSNDFGWSRQVVRTVDEDIPLEVRPYLKHLPTIATWIGQDKKISGAQMWVFKKAFRQAYDFFKASSFEEIRRMIEPYSNHPRHGQYVRLALSP